MCRFAIGGSAEAHATKRATGGLIGHACVRRPARPVDLHPVAQCQAPPDRRLSADHAGPGPGLGDRGADRRPRPPGGEARHHPPDDRNASGPGAVRDEPRLRRRHGRNGRAAVARATCRLPCGARGRAAIAGAGGGYARRPVAKRCACRPRRDARPTRLGRALRPAQAGHRRAACRRVGAAREDGARAGLRPRCRGGGRGVAWPRAALCAAVRLGRGPGTAARQRESAGVSPVHARPPTGGRPRRSRGLCRGVEVGRNPGAAGACRWRDPALQSRRGRHHRQLPGGRGRLCNSWGARRRTAGEGRGTRPCAGRRGRRGQLQCAPAATGAQDGVEADAGRLSRLCPPL